MNSEKRIFLFLLVLLGQGTNGSGMPTARPTSNLVASVVGKYQGIVAADFPNVGSLDSTQEFVFYSNNTYCEEKSNENAVKDDELSDCFHLCSLQVWCNYISFDYVLQECTLTETCTAQQYDGNYEAEIWQTQDMLEERPNGGEQKSHKVLIAALVLLAVLQIMCYVAYRRSRRKDNFNFDGQPTNKKVQTILEKAHAMHMNELNEDVENPTPLSLKPEVKTESNSEDQKETSESNPEELIVGWLVKEGGYRKTMKRRYCVLSSDKKFCYYTNNDRKVLKGEVDFSVARVKQTVRHFEVETKTRTWKFKAQSQELATQWVGHLKPKGTFSWTWTKSH